MTDAPAASVTAPPSSTGRVAGQSHRRSRAASSRPIIRRSRSLSAVSITLTSLNSTHLRPSSRRLSRPSAPPRLLLREPLLVLRARWHWRCRHRRLYGWRLRLQSRLRRRLCRRSATTGIRLSGIRTISGPTHVGAVWSVICPAGWLPRCAAAAWWVSPCLGPSSW